MESTSTDQPEDPSQDPFSSFILPLKFEPGESWVHGVGIDWAGKAVELLTKTSLEDYLQGNIFRPLDLNSTTFRIGSHPELQSRRATVSLRVVSGGPLAATANPSSDHPLFNVGGSGLYSTAADYSKVLSALLDGGKGILDEETLRNLNKPQLADSTGLENHILGENHLIFAPEYPKELAINHGLAGLLNLEDIPGKRRSGSLTWSGLTNARWWFDPVSGIAATLFVHELYDELERAVYQQFGQGTA